MGIPDCFDPVWQEERRQRAWDVYAARRPKCALCGAVLMPGELAAKVVYRWVCRFCREEAAEAETERLGD